MKNVSETFVEKIRTHFFVSRIFYEHFALYEIMWKNILEPDVTEDNMAHAHCMLDT
jgi:hypothetical protein